MTRLSRRQAFALASSLVERAQEPKGLCTMFLFDGVAHPDVLHVTHKYFGKDGGVNEEAVQTILNAWFSHRPFTPFRVSFSTLEYLGENRDIRVLLPEPGNDALFLPGLKSHLDLLKADKFPEYIPHVTVNDNMDRCDYPIVDFVLARGGEILWRASQLKGDQVEPTYKTKMTRLSSITTPGAEMVEEGEINGTWFKFYSAVGFFGVPEFSFRWVDPKTGQTMASGPWESIEVAQKMAERRSQALIATSNLRRLSEETVQNQRTIREVSDSIRKAGTEEPIKPLPKTEEDMKKSPREYLTKRG